jgi:hypothetical protein
VCVIGVDPRLRLAVDASLAWYDDVFALHGIAVARSDGLWRALDDPPAYHSAVKTIVPGVDADRVLEATEPFASCSVADSFGDMCPSGFALRFEAVWLHLDGGFSAGLPAGWSVVSSPAALARWSDRHDYAGVLRATTLDNPRFTVLARSDGDDLIGGAIVHDGAAAVGLSNTWSAEGHEPDWDALLAAARAVHPGRPLTDYAHGDDLTGMLRLGFQPLGPQRVWVR